MNAVGVILHGIYPAIKNIAGLNETIASNIVQYRETNGRFKSRHAIKTRPRLGEKIPPTGRRLFGLWGRPFDVSAVQP